MSLIDLFAKNLNAYETGTRNGSTTPVGAVSNRTDTQH